LALLKRAVTVLVLVETYEENPVLQKYVLMNGKKMEQLSLTALYTLVLGCTKILLQTVFEYKF
jgi:hypothetical protein